MMWLYHWCWRNGVQGNLAASAVIAIPAYLFGWRKHIKPHLERSKVLHQLVDEIHTKVHDA